MAVNMFKVLGRGKPYLTANRSSIFVA